METTETNIVLLLRKIVRAVEIDSKKLSTQFNTTPAQLLALRQLSGVQEKSLAKLAEAVGLTSSTMVGVVDRLEKKGLVVRNRSQKDRRLVNIVITEAGVTYLKGSPKLLQDKLTERLSTHTEAEKSTIFHSLKKITDIFDAQSIDVSPVLDSGGLI
jgi:DNA-binding MarR family transcriptional regulator